VGCWQVIVIGEKYGEELRRELGLLKAASNSITFSASHLWGVGKLLLLVKNM
jgi:hypothetical protein